VGVEALSEDEQHGKYDGYARVDNPEEADSSDLLESFLVGRRQVAQKEKDGTLEFRNGGERCPTFHAFFPERGGRVDFFGAEQFVDFRIGVGALLFVGNEKVTVFLEGIHNGIEIGLGQCRNILESAAFSMEIRARKRRRKRIDGNKYGFMVSGAKGRVIDSETLAYLRIYFPAL